MGTFRHHTIVVTGRPMELVNHARQIALMNFSNLDGMPGERLISPIIESVTNQFYSFFIAPDGSKEYREASDAADEARAKFVDFLYQNRALEYVEVAFSYEDVEPAKVINFTDKDQFLPK